MSPAPAPRAPPARAAPGLRPARAPMPVPRRPPAAAPVPAAVSQPLLRAKLVSRPATKSVRIWLKAVGLHRTLIVPTPAACRQCLTLPERAEQPAKRDALADNMSVSSPSTPAEFPSAEAQMRTEASPTLYPIGQEKEYT